MGFFKEIQQVAARCSSAVAVEEVGGLVKTYGELAQELVRYTAWYEHRTEERFAVMAGSSYLWICHVFGILCAGKHVVLIDSLLPADNIITLSQYADAQVLLTDVQDRKVAAAAAQAGITYEVFTEPDGIVETSDDIEAGDMIVFTSGTSGRAKGVVLTADVVWDKTKILASVHAAGIEGKMYIPLPLAHLYGIIMAMRAMCEGRTVCIGSPRHISEEIAYFKPAILNIVPSIVEYLFKNGIPTDTVRQITVAGAKCDKILEQQATERGIILQNMYGASETAGAIALNLIGDPIDHMTPMDDVTVTLTPGGETVIRTRGMTEYYHLPEQTAQVLKDGCIYMGDQGEFHEDGTFNPLGRRQDMVAMKNGSKLYYTEVDEELSHIALVQEACVLYVWDHVVAVVVARAEDEAQVIKNIKAYNKKQPYFRKIEDIWVRQEPLPRTGIGKLSRRAVLAQYEEVKKHG